MAAINAEKTGDISEEKPVEEPSSKTKTSISIQHLKPFLDELSSLNPWGLTVTVTGTRSSGKTHLTKFLFSHLKKLRKIDAIFLISATANQQFDSGAYSYIPRQFQYTELEELTNIFDKQREVVRYNQRLEDLMGTVKPTHSKPPKFVESRVAVIIDDFYGLNVRHANIISEVCTHGRHLSYVHPRTKEVLVRVDTFFLSQDLTQLSTVQRANMDLLITSRALSYRAAKQTTEGFLSLVSRKEGYELLRSLSETPYMFAAIDVTRQPKRKLEDFVFQIKAPREVAPFRIGEQYFDKDEKKK